MKALLSVVILMLLASLVTGWTGAQREQSSRSTEQPAADGDGRPRWLIGSSCTVTPDPPVRDRSAERIVGSARYRCGRPGGEVDVTLYLQKRAANGSWTTLDKRLVGAHGADTTSARKEKQRTQSATAPCADGVYRTFVSGTLSASGKTRLVEQDSAAVTNPCQSARR
jgi:hypothetical protein